MVDPGEFWALMSHRESGCWEWTGRARRGYGSVQWGPKHTTPHRVAFQLAHPGVAIDGLHVHHVCQNKMCCNPAHLQLLPPGEHIRLHVTDDDRCLRGHLFDVENTRLQFQRGGVARVCRTCVRERRRREWHENLEASRARDAAKKRKRRQRQKLLTGLGGDVPNTDGGE